MTMHEARSWTVSAEHAVTYRLREVEGVFDRGNDSVARAAALGAGRTLCVIDATVDRIIRDEVRDYFAAYGASMELLVLDRGEDRKNLDAVVEVLTAMDRVDPPRRARPVVAIGGGVLLDIVGLACSLYRRGTPYVRIPTSLLAIVDAAVGVKTAVNFGGHKSRIGTYYPALVSLIDPALLATLPPRHIRNGMAEIVKIAVVRNRALFELIEANAERCGTSAVFTTDTGRAVIAAAIDTMVRELEPNLWEAELERAADFGHSFSPGIEMSVLPELLHGEAVAIDIALSVVVSSARGRLMPRDRDRVLSVLHRLGLPLCLDTLTVDLLADALAATTSHRDGLQRLPLPTAIGACEFVNDVTHGEITAALASLRAGHETTTRVAQ
jgi:3-dehydroquinate synthetase